jgi:phenylpyruvate tautomerase PptA (4-oxalocrotonate tautomerase family)
MPTYVCSAATGRLTSDQNAEIARSITAIHHDETGAPLYLFQVIFYDIAAGSHDIAGRPSSGNRYGCGPIFRTHARTSRRAECSTG